MKEQLGNVGKGEKERKVPRKGEEKNLAGRGASGDEHMEEAGKAE